MVEKSWEEAIEQSLIEHADIWERMAKGHTKDDLTLAYLLRSIIADIEGPHAPNWSDVLFALGYVRCEVEKRAGIPSVSIPSIWTEDGRFDSDSTTTTNATDMEWTVLYVDGTRDG